MATYKHGVYTSEQATSMTAPVTGTAGLQVVVGTAPVNMLEYPEQAVNTPLLVYNYKEAVAAVGYHDDFAAYTLCESISAAFSVVGTGPLVLINVLDPAKHTADIAETTVQVNSGVAVLDAVGVLLDKLTVKSGSTALTRDTDYTASFNNDGTLNIVPLAGGKAASATTLTVTGKKLDPSKVKAADIVGGVDAATGKETGLEVVRQIYPKLSMTPGILLAPRFSMDATVAAALQAKAKEINGVFKAVCIVDIDSTESGATKYTDVKQRKEAQAVSDANAYAVWPCAKVGEVVYSGSALAAALTAYTDAVNADTPNVSPSNKTLAISAACLADGTEERLWRCHLPEHERFPPVGQQHRRVPQHHRPERQMVQCTALPVLGSEQLYPDLLFQGGQPRQQAADRGHCGQRECARQRLCGPWCVRPL